MFLGHLSEGCNAQSSLLDHVQELLRAALNQGGCHFTSHWECTSWTIPAQAETSASGEV